MSGQDVERVLRATSVIIPVRDDVRIDTCIASVDEDVEVVVSMNGASDEVREIVCSSPRRPRAVETPAPNIGAAYNAGIEAAGGRHLLLMDSDCLFEPGTIRRLAHGALRAPFVKGRVRFRPGRTRLEMLVERSRSHHTAVQANAYSPPLLYDRRVIDLMGGYHFCELLHFREDREFDFRRQLAGLPVVYLPDAIVHHAPLRMSADLRSAFRYGIAEAIGRDIGVFPSHAHLPTLVEHLRSFGEALAGAGPAVALYYLARKLAFYGGMAYQRGWDPYGLALGATRSRDRVRVASGPPHVGTILDEPTKAALRAAQLRRRLRHADPGAANGPPRSDAARGQSA